MCLGLPLDQTGSHRGSCQPLLDNKYIYITHARRLRLPERDKAVACFGATRSPPFYQFSWRTRGSVFYRASLLQPLFFGLWDLYWWLLFFCFFSLFFLLFFFFQPPPPPLSLSLSLSLVLFCFCFVCLFVCFLFLLFILKPL